MSYDLTVRDDTFSIQADLMPPFITINNYSISVEHIVYYSKSADAMSVDTMDATLHKKRKLEGGDAQDVSAERESRLSQEGSAMQPDDKKLSCADRLYHTADSRKGPTFLKCHKEFLLYLEGKLSPDETAVDADLWALLDLFLKHWQQLQLLRQKADIATGVYKEASSIVDDHKVRQDKTINRLQSHNYTPTSPAISYRKHERQTPSSKSPHKPTQQAGTPLSRFSSFHIISQLVEKQMDIANNNLQANQRVFERLLTIAQERVHALRDVAAQVKEFMLSADCSGNESHTTRLATMSMKSTADEDIHSRLAEVETCIHLWQRLLHDLKNGLGE
jgi:hypothetical protein